jgi:hypothetical protein
MGGPLSTQIYSFVVRDPFHIFSNITYQSDEVWTSDFFSKCQIAVIFPDKTLSKICLKNKLIININKDALCIPNYLFILCPKST